MTFAPRFSDIDQVVIAVSDDSDGCAALQRNHAHLSGRQSHRRIFSFLCHQLRAHACRADHLTAFAWVELDIVYLRTDRDILKRQTVADTHFRFRTAHNHHTVRQSCRGENISLLSVQVADQRDICRAVRIILDSDYLCRNTVLAVSLKIDDSVFSPVAAAAMSDSDFTLIVPAGIFLQRNRKRLFRRFFGDFGKIRPRHMSSGRCIRFIGLDSHGCSPFAVSC